MLLAAAALIAAGCQETLEYTDVVFFTGTETSATTSLYVEGPTSLGLTVTSSCKMSETITVSVEIDASAIDTYNEANGTSYVMLPDGSYDLASSVFTIESGSSVSNPMNFEILSMDDFNDGDLYCVPITLTGTSNGMKILEASKTIYVVISQIITTQAPNLQGSNYVSFPTTINNSTYSDLSACTMEARVKMDRWQTSSPYISSIVGVEENFLLRFGDVSCDNNQLQYAGRGASVTSVDSFNTDTWYHVYVVDDGSTLTLYVDGEQQGTTDSSGKDAIDLGWNYCDGFHVGFSETGRKLYGTVSEVRVWTRALTVTELENNQCYVDPSSEGLLGYWRLDELDEDGYFTDLTGNGNYGEPSSTSLVWEEIKCPVVD